MKNVMGIKKGLHEVRTKFVLIITRYTYNARGWGFGNGGANELPVKGFFSYDSESSLQREIECPKRFNLTPSMKTLLKRNIAAFAAGFRANSKYRQNQSQASLGLKDWSIICI
ncbi:hypothetical protein RND71_015961 [Anisodus tanguticus]|uniref:Uncharacterized protein n=1 Tax=Anisodus tanguticus TaxID=243964 RepID=A0AAE1S6J5_9SOLA|nr:hypothetical protein RND71_015961 [Anisodus tanguticus]